MERDRPSISVLALTSRATPTTCSDRPVTGPPGPAVVSTTNLPTASSPRQKCRRGQHAALARPRPPRPEGPRGAFADDGDRLSGFAIGWREIPPADDRNTH